MMGPDDRIEVSEEHGPLVVVRWPAGRVPDSELSSFLEVADEQMQRLGPHAVLHVGVRALGLSVTQHRYMTQHVNESRERLAAHVIAAAVVAPSPILRGSITAMNWLAPPPFEQRVFGGEEVARAWLHEALERAHGR